MHGREVAWKLERPYYLNGEAPTKKYEMRQDVNWDQSKSEQQAYKMQFFMDPLSMPKMQILNSKQIDMSFLKSITNINGDHLYPHIDENK